MKFFPALFSLSLALTGFVFLPKVAIAQSNIKINHNQQDKSTYKIQLDNLLKDGYTKLEAKDISGAITNYKQAYQLAQSHKNVFDQSRILAILGRVYDFDGRYADAERAYQEGIKLLQNDQNLSYTSEQQIQHDSLQVDLLTGLGMSYRKISQLTEAANLLKLSVSLTHHLPFPESARLHLESRFELATVYKNERKYKDAITLYQECLKLVRQIGDREKENITLTALANTYLLMGDLKHGREIYSQKNKSLDFSQPVKLSGIDDLESIEATLSNLVSLLEKTIPSLRQTSRELLRMYTLVRVDQRFGVIGQLSETVGLSADLITSLSSTLKQGDILSAFSMMQSLDEVMTKLTAYEKGMDVLMQSVQQHPESYKVLTPEVLREMEEIGHNLEKINQSLGGKSKSATQKTLIDLDKLKKN